MRRAVRVDKNHTAVVKAFRDLGCSVLSLSAVGDGCPDLLIATPRATALVEVKDGTTYYSRKPRKSQEDFSAVWRGRIFLCKSIVEVPGIVEQL